MFKKICVLLFLLLLLFFSVMSVDASAELQYNETDDVEYNTNTINNINVSVDDKLSDNDNEIVDTDITLSLQQGEHVEIVFNQFKLIKYQNYKINDDYIFCDRNISGDDMHVYVPLSAIGNGAVNVGMNTLTVEYFGYPYNVEKINSNSIQFKTMDLNGTYKDHCYKINLNISKKQEKTIQIINKNNITYHYYGYAPIYYKLKYIDDFSFREGNVQAVVSKNKKIYYTGLISSYQEIPNNYYSIDVNSILFFDKITIPTGFYNLTLVNYDGTNDTCICEFKKLPWNITFGYNIMNDTVLFYFDAWSFISSEDYSDYNMIIKLGNITKLIPSEKFDIWKISDWNVTVLFNDLDDGCYDVVIEILGNDYIEDFLYTTQIEIGTTSPVHNDNITEDIRENNVTNNTVISLINITGDSDSNSSVLSHGNNSNSNSDTVSGSDGKKHSSNKIEDNIDKFKEYVSDYGDLESTRSMQSVDNAKSYEISEKSVSKSIDDLLTKIGVTIFSCMSLMVGYVRFEKKYQ